MKTFETAKELAKERTVKKSMRGRADILGEGQCACTKIAPYLQWAVHLLRMQEAPMPQQTWTIIQDNLRFNSNRTRATRPDL